MTREEAKQRLLDTAWLGSNEDRDKTEEAVKVLITALEQEPKVGHWIDGDRTKWKCSNCGYGVLDWNNTPYCPNCGAKMESEDKE